MVGTSGLETRSMFSMYHHPALNSVVKPNLWNLFVVFDLPMSPESDSKQLVRNCFYYFRNTSKLGKLRSKQELQIGIHTFISSRLDYILFTCINRKFLITFSWSKLCRKTPNRHNPQSFNVFALVTVLPTSCNSNPQVTKSNC
ncbi:hypothetical protein GOODEAATRI_025852 [Goodea atripinnis]|uniref:Maturase K n=1 Tax=Goodea atripinnis TaxID=208336 RepID=A0ABV0PH71_9TELE